MDVEAKENFIVAIDPLTFDTVFNTSFVPFDLPLNYPYDSFQLLISFTIHCRLW